MRNNDYFDSCKGCDRRGSEICHTSSCKDYAVAKIRTARDKARATKRKELDNLQKGYAIEKKNKRLHRKKLSGK